jgi:hypothetical protein
MNMEQAMQPEPLALTDQQQREREWVLLIRRLRVAAILPPKAQLELKRSVLCAQRQADLVLWQLLTLHWEQAPWV